VFFSAFVAFCFSTCFLVVLLDYKCSYNYTKNSTSSTNNKSNKYKRNNENNKRNKSNNPNAPLQLLRVFVFALLGVFALVVGVKTMM
jgi:Ca2+/Na+ antiporter